MRVSQAGYDATTNPVDNTKLTFGSDWPSLLPVYQTGSVSLGTSASASVSFTSLGYIPYAAVCLYTADTTNSPLAYLYNPNGTTGPGYWLGASFNITSSSLTINNIYANSSLYYMSTVAHYTIFMVKAV